jgi:peptidoglycan/LPS O-acetylase OafA/YrhL
MGCHLAVHLGLPADADVARQFLFAGWTGVLVFFVLSGFLLGLPYMAWRRGEAPRPDTSAYLVRRIWRVFPPYYVQLLVLAGLAALGLPLLGQLVSAWEWLAHLGMWFHLGPDPVRPLNGVWWTLPVEFGFYLLLPFAALLALRRTPLMLAGVALAVALAYHALGWLWLGGAERHLLSAFIGQLPGNLPAFAFGVAGAWWFLAGRAAPRSSNALALGGLALLLALVWILPFADAGRAYWENPGFYYLWRPAASLAIALLVFAAAQGAASVAVLGSRPLRYLGDISYSLYLWHLPVIVAVAQWLPAWSMAPSWALAIAATWMLSHASARWVERPSIAVGRRLAARVAARRGLALPRVDLRHTVP